MGFEYNASGQITQENLNGQPLIHSYDGAGIRNKLQGAHTPLGLHWQQGQLQQLNIGSHPAVHFTHNTAGLETLRDNQQGFRFHQRWSKTGLLEQQQLGYVNERTTDLAAEPKDRYLLRQYQYDALDRLTGMDESYFGKTELRLNPNGQISEIRQTKAWQDKVAQVQLFGYDSELNLNQHSVVPVTDNVIDLASKRAEKTHHYDQAGRVLKKGPFSYRYDECGRLIEKIEHRDGYRAKSTKFVWNAFDQLIKVELPNQERWRYRYDPFGRRIAKECEQSANTLNKHDIHYLWDGDTLIQQQKVCADGTALTTTEWVYEPESFRPFAQINTDHTQGTSALSYIITDHAGTPRELCNEEGNIIWRGQHEVWGGYQAQSLQGLHKKYLEEAANDPIECDLRYQGQIYDKETGLYYNRHRYYDTDSGQYLSPDPIGMAGGLRPQGYVHNPMDWVDPLGLAPVCNSPNGYKTGDVDSHGNLSPNRNRASGHTNARTDGFVQSHHPIQDAWAKKRINGYKRNSAPATLLQSSSGSPHAGISSAQRTRRALPNGWDTTLKQEFNISYKEMLDSGVSKRQARKAISDSYKYFDGLRGSNKGNPFFDLP